MPRIRNSQDVAAGQLIRAIQRVQNGFAGQLPQWYEAQEVMDRAHHLQLAAVSGTLEQLLAGRAVIDYLGVKWIILHPQTLLSVQSLEATRSA